MYKVFAVYTASRFYKLYFQAQNMYYHSTVTLTSAKRSTFPPAPWQQATHLTQVSSEGLQLLYNNPRDEN